MAALDTNVVVRLIIGDDAAQARVAEALHCGRRLPWLAADESDPEAGKFLHDQWARNHMLAKWLEYLLEHGNGFTLTARPRSRSKSSAASSGA